MDIYPTHSWYECKNSSNKIQVFIQKFYKMDVTKKNKIFASVFRLAVQSVMPDITIRHWLRKKTPDNDNVFELSIGDQVYLYTSYNLFCNPL